jgi:hypothetical protein
MHAAVQLTSAAGFSPMLLSRRGRLGLPSALRWKHSGRTHREPS